MKQTTKEETLRYHYIKLALASQMIFEMQGELKNSTAWSGKVKNAAHIIKVQSQYQLEKDINSMFGADDEVANKIIKSIENVAEELCSLDADLIGKLYQIIKKTKTDNCILIDRGYYEELEKIKVKYNKIK